MDYAGRNIKVRTALKKEGSKCKKRKCHLNLYSIAFQRKSHKNFN